MGRHTIRCIHLCGFSVDDCEGMLGIDTLFPCCKVSSELLSQKQQSQSKGHKGVPMISAIPLIPPVDTHLQPRGRCPAQLL